MKNVIFIILLVPFISYGQKIKGVATYLKGGLGAVEMPDLSAKVYLIKYTQELDSNCSHLRRYESEYYKALELSVRNRGASDSVIEVVINKYAPTIKLIIAAAIDKSSCNSTGEYYFENIPAGKYLLMLESNKCFTSYRHKVLIMRKDHTENEDFVSICDY